MSQMTLRRNAAVMIGRIRQCIGRVGRWEWLAFALLCLLSVVSLQNSRNYVGNELDDSYITFRHSLNLLKGDGPVYNPGERVEGTSAFLFMLLMVPVLALGKSAMAFAIVISILSFIMLMVVSYAVVTLYVPRGPERLVGVGAAWMIASSTQLAFYTQTGMETLFYSLLLHTGVCLHLAASVRGGRYRAAWGLAMGAAAMTRPEGAAFFVLLFGLDAMRRLIARQPWRVALRELAIPLTMFATVYLPLLLFRRAYFGTWIPNSVLAKSGSASHLINLSLSQYVNLLTHGQGAEIAKFIVGRLGLAAYVIPLGLLSARLRYPVVVALAVTLSFVALYEWNDGDWFPHARLMIPCIAPLAVATAISASGLRIGVVPTRIALRVGGMVVSTVVFLSSARAMKYEEGDHSWHSRLFDYMQSMSRTLGTVRRDDDLLVTDIAGMTPYLSGLHTVDFFGLCDAAIARTGCRFGAMGKIDWNYVIRRRPTFWLFNLQVTFAELYRNPAFEDQVNDYWAVVTPEYLRSGQEGKLLIVRKDRLDLDKLVAALDAQLVDVRDELRRLGR